ncbi:MAG: PilZ domain-containing protein [Bryobacteraceae bacterium]
MATVAKGTLRDKDLRRHPRFSVDKGTLRASWVDEKGQLRVAQARVPNISESGMALVLPEQPRESSVVKLSSEKHRLLGSAAVRYTRRVGPNCIVGVEFVNGLRWTPPPDESIQEPIQLSDQSA